MLFCPVSLIYFYIMYLFCGFTDMVDGTIARKTKSVSEFGAKLDTVADIVFAAVCFVKILPLIQFPTWLWIWIVIIATSKIGNVVVLFDKPFTICKLTWQNYTVFGILLP